MSGPLARSALEEGGRMGMGSQQLLRYNAYGGCVVLSMSPAVVPVTFSDDSAGGPQRARRPA
jgi:hypothetical protein